METKVSFDLDDDVVEKVSQIAKDSGLSVEQLIRDYLYLLASRIED